MPECVVIRFTGEVSIYPGTLLSALADDNYNDYKPEDSRCGYSVSPESSEIAKEIRIWAPDIKRLYLACPRVIYGLEAKIKKPILFEIRIEEGGK